MSRVTILLRGPPNGCSQYNSFLCHEGDTVAFILYVLLFGHSNENFPQVIEQYGAIQIILFGKRKPTPSCPVSNKQEIVIVWFTKTFDEDITSNIASPEK